MLACIPSGVVKSVAWEQVDEEPDGESANPVSPGNPQLKRGGWDIHIGMFS